VNVYQIDHGPTLGRFGLSPIQRTICELRLSGLSYTQIIEMTPDIPYNWQISKCLASAAAGFAWNVHREAGRHHYLWRQDERPSRCNCRRDR
jgi:hypothetical protein